MLKPSKSGALAYSEKSKINHEKPDVNGSSSEEFDDDLDSLNPDAVSSEENNKSDIKRSVK